MKKNQLIGLIFTLLIAFNLAGCNEKAPQTTNQSNNNITEVNFDELMKYKDSYVGDNSAVVSIVYGLPAHQYNPTFELKTKAEPYKIIIHYEANDETADETILNFWNENNPDELLENNAIILFSLIPNVDVVEFEVEGMNEAENHSYQYSRKELELKYDVNLIDLSVSEDSLADFFKNKE